MVNAEEFLDLYKQKIEDFKKHQLEQKNALNKKRPKGQVPLK